MLVCMINLLHQFVITKPLFMKTKILLSFCCLFSITSFSQDSVYQLKDYKYRTPGYRTLVFSASVSGGLTDQKNTGGDSLKGRNFHLFPTSVYYTKIVSTDQKLSRSVISLNASYDSYSNESRLNTYKYRTGDGSFAWQFDNLFFRDNKWYWQIGNRLSGEGNLQKSSHLYDKKEFSASNEVILGFGKGRIEMVQDAQMALYILNDLEQQGLINAPVDHQTINSFAQLITQINNRRVFDFRRKRIFELTQIDSFLRNKGITRSLDIRLFTTINDNWSYGYNPLRSAGSDWFFRLVPFYGFNIDKNSNFSDYSLQQSTHTLGVRPEIGYENYKPVNLKWQRDLGARFSWSYDRHHFAVKNINSGTISKFKSTGDFTQSQLNLFYGLGYYPSNRSKVNGTLKLSGSIGEGAYWINPSIDFSADYFVSYRTRLSAYLSTIYQYDRLNFTGVLANNAHSLNVNFGVTISHAFL
jgi:hypothetical protein